MNKSRIVIADDHAIVREGIKMLINSQTDMEVVGEASDGETAWRQVRELKPDVVVMDVSMPKLNGAQATERVTTMLGDTKVLALSAYSDESHVRELLAAGASGYVLKKAISQELTAAIRTIVRGGVHLDPAVAGAVVVGFITPQPEGSESRLSPRERDVLRLLAWGHTNKEIADRLHLSVKTIEGHRARAMSRMGFESRVDIVRFALRMGWLKDE